MAQRAPAERCCTAAFSRCTVAHTSPRALVGARLCTVAHCGAARRVRRRLSAGLACSAWRRWRSSPASAPSTARARTSCEYLRTPTSARARPRQARAVPAQLRLIGQECGLRALAAPNLLQWTAGCARECANALRPHELLDAALRTRWVRVEYTLTGWPFRADGALAAHAERYFLRPYNPHELAAVERTLLHTLERISAKKQRCALLCWRTERSRRTERCTPSTRDRPSPSPRKSRMSLRCAVSHARTAGHVSRRNTAADVAR